MPAKFLVVGAANTVVGLLIIYLSKWLLAFGDVQANISGYLIGLCVSFVLNRGWTFAYRGAVIPALMRFLATFLAAYLVNLVTVLAAIRMFQVDAYVAQALSIVPYTVVFYLGGRYFAFRSAHNTDA